MLIAHNANYDCRFLLEYLSKENTLVKGGRVLTCSGYYYRYQDKKQPIVIKSMTFYDAIKNNTLPEVSLEDGLMSVAIGQAAELSIKENRVIKMSEFNL